MKRVLYKKPARLINRSCPIALAGPVRVVEGQPTNSVADQEAIKALFPNTYGLPKSASKEPRTRSRQACQRWCNT